MFFLAQTGDPRKVMAHWRVVLEEEEDAPSKSTECDYDGAWEPASKPKTKTKANGEHKHRKKPSADQATAAAIFYPRRPRPHRAPVDIAHNLCNFVKRGKRCRYGKRCLFAHSEEELEKWEASRLQQLGLLEDDYDYDYDDDDLFGAPCDDGFCVCDSCTKKRHPQGEPAWTQEDEDEYIEFAAREMMDLIFPNNHQEK